MSDKKKVRCPIRGCDCPNAIAYKLLGTRLGESLWIIKCPSCGNTIENEIESRIEILEQGHPIVLHDHEITDETNWHNEFKLRQNIRKNKSRSKWGFKLLNKIPRNAKMLKKDAKKIPIDEKVIKIKDFLVKYCKEEICKDFDYKDKTILNQILGFDDEDLEKLVFTIEEEYGVYIPSWIPNHRGYLTIIELAKLIKSKL